jgi:hypothetical protein
MSHIFNNAEPGSQLIWTVMIPFSVFPNSALEFRSLLDLVLDLPRLRQRKCGGLLAPLRSSYEQG